MHKANAINHEVPEVRTAAWRRRLSNAVKHQLAPLAIVAAGLAPIAQAVASPAQAFAGRSHPVFRFRDYNQGDWGSRYASTGCGPTAMAMVVATEANDSHITPHTIGAELSPKYWAPGSGTLASGFQHVSKHYGIESDRANLQDAEDVIADGGLAIVHAKPGPWTSAGHYMVLKSVNDSGEFRLADPNDAPGRNTEDQWWSPDQLKANGVDAVWTFTPSENMF